MQDKIPDKELNKVMAWLAEKMRCPLCGYQYNLGGIRIVPKVNTPGREVMVHTDCGKCDCSLLFALDVRGGEVFLVGVVTDLTHEDALKFQNMKSLGSDEIIDWHYFWNTFDGDFERALT